MLRTELDSQAMDVEVLDTWYKKDSNAVPPISVLQPISSILKNFNNKVERLILMPPIILAEDIFFKPSICVIAANSKTSTGRSSRLVGHYGEDAKIVSKGCSIAIQLRQIRQRHYAQLLHVWSEL